MDIEIKYKFLNILDIKQLRLTPELYYDKYENIETFDDERIPKFDKAIEYLYNLDNSLPLDKIEYTIIEIKDSTNIYQTIKTTYFGQGQSEVTNRKDKDGFELIIQSFKIATNCIHISRMERNGYDKEWKINSSIGLNYEMQHIDEEVWLSSINGEFVNQTMRIN